MSIEDRYQSLIAAYASIVVSHRIKVLRLAWEMSQSEMARQLNLAPNTISQFETGVSRPSQDVETRIKAAFGVTVDWIRYGEMSGLSSDLIRKLEEASVNIRRPKERARDKRVPPPAPRTMKRPARRPPSKKATP